MLKKILLGASIVTATTKIVTDICEAYEEAEDKPKGLSIIPFVLQVLARGGKDMKNKVTENFKENIVWFCDSISITKKQLYTSIVASTLIFGVTFGGLTLYYSNIIKEV